MGQRLNLPAKPPLTSSLGTFASPFWSLCSLTCFLGIVPYDGDTWYLVAVIGSSRWGLCLLLDISTLQPRRVPWTQRAHNKWWSIRWKIINDLQFTRLYIGQSFKKWNSNCGSLFLSSQSPWGKDILIHIKPLNLLGVSEGLAVVASGTWQIHYSSSPSLAQSAWEYQDKPGLSEKVRFTGSLHQGHRRGGPVGYRTTQKKNKNSYRFGREGECSKI